MDKLYYLLINENVNNNTFSKLLKLILKEKQRQIKRFHFAIDKKLSLYAELLVRIMACQILGIDNVEIKFDKLEYGKPYIKNYPDFHYNITHTRNAVVVAISDNPIGVDIERIRKAELIIANRFFVTNEQTYINQIIDEADKRFFEVWTKKEAYIKYIGKGLSMPLNSFNVLDETISQQMKSFVKDDYIISVCVECPFKKYEIIEINEIQVESMAFSFLK